MADQKDNRTSVEDISYSITRDKFSYVSQKTAKISGVFYKLTDTLSDKEPLKWRIRGAASRLPLELYMKDSFPARLPAEAIKRTFNLLRTLTDIGVIAGFFLDTHRDIIFKEFSTIENLFTDNNLNNSLENIQSLMWLPEPTVSSTNALGRSINPISHGSNSKGHTEYKGHDKRHNIKDITGVPQGNHKESGGAFLIDRKKRIVQMVRKIGEVSIKDITKGIPGVSEKTIQRDLLDLVAHGHLEKSGERRWSRYRISTLA